MNGPSASRTERVPVDHSNAAIARRIAALSVPVCLSFLLQNAYHINDAWFLGKVGPAATNAMGLFMMVMIANFGFIFMIARGTQSLIARRVGAQRERGANAALAQGLGLGMLWAVPLALVQAWSIETVLTWMGGDAETVRLGAEYLRVMFLFIPFLFAAPILEFAFQAFGDMKTPFRLQLLAVIVNTVLNWLLVLPHDFNGLSFGGHGVTGAAIATGTSRAVSSLLAFSILRRRSHTDVLARVASYRVDKTMSREILRIGIPSGSSTLLYAGVSFVLLRILAEVAGQEALGAYAIGFRSIESLSFMLILGFGVGTGTVAGHAAGAGLMERVRRAGHVGVGLGCAAMAVTTLLFATIPEQLASIYTDDATIIRLAGSYVAWMAFCQIPHAIEMVYQEAMAGAGSSLRTAVITIPGNVLRIPLAWWFAVELDWGIEGVWAAIVASALFKSVGVSWLFLSRRWEAAVAAGRYAVEADA